MEKLLKIARKIRPVMIAFDWAMFASVIYFIGRPVFDEGYSIAGAHWSLLGLYFFSCFWCALRVSINNMKRA